MCEGGSILNYPLNDLNSLLYPEFLPAKPLANITLCGSKNQFPLDILWCSSIWGLTPPIRLPCATGTISGLGRVTLPAGLPALAPPPPQLPPEFSYSSPYLTNWGRPSGTLTPRCPLWHGPPGSSPWDPGPHPLNSTGSLSPPAALPGRPLTVAERSTNHTH